MLGRVGNAAVDLSNYLIMAGCQRLVGDNELLVLRLDSVSGGGKGVEAFG